MPYTQGLDSRPTDIDHNYWGRPQDQDTSPAKRPTYVWNLTTQARLLWRGQSCRWHGCLWAAAQPPSHAAALSEQSDEHATGQVVLWQLGGDRRKKNMWPCLGCCAARV